MSGWKLTRGREDGTLLWLPILAQDDRPQVATFICIDTVPSLSQVHNVVGRRQSTSRLKETRGRRRCYRLLCRQPLWTARHVRDVMCALHYHSDFPSVPNPRLACEMTVLPVTQHPHIHDMPECRPKRRVPRRGHPTLPSVMTTWPYPDLSMDALEPQGCRAVRRYGRALFLSCGEASRPSRGRASPRNRERAVGRSAPRHEAPGKGCRPACWATIGHGPPTNQLRLATQREVR